MIRTFVNEVDQVGNEKPLGWCLFGQVPISMPPQIPGAPPEAQPQASPILYMIGGKMYFILGYRWQSDTLCGQGQNIAEDCDAYLFLVVKEVRQAKTIPALVRADAGALGRLPIIGKKN